MKTTWKWSGFAVVAAMAGILAMGCEQPTSRPAPDGVEPERAEFVERGQPRWEAPLRRVPIFEEHARQSGITVEEVEEFLERWVAVQNRGDFDGYAGLYSSSFEGLFLPGEASLPLEFSRQEWLDAEFERFQRPMQVGVEHLEIEPFDKTAEVLFVETRKEGTTGYEGPKELVLMREEGELRIAAEVMVEVRAEEVEVELEPPPRDELAMVMEAGDDEYGATYVVLETAPEPDWFHSIVEYKGHRAARAAAMKEMLPPNLAGWQGRTVQLFDGDGRRCEARITGLYGLMRAIPHFGQVHQWRGIPGTSGELMDEPATREVIADGVWELGDRPLLVGQVDYDGDCAHSNPVWAHSDVGTSQPLLPVELNEYEIDAVLGTFRELHNYRRIQERFLGYVDEEELEAARGSWSTYMGAHPEVHAWMNPEQGRVFAFVAVESGMGCGFFYGSLAQIVEIRGDEEFPWVVAWGEFTEFMRPTVMIDVGGEGIPHVVGESGQWGTEDFLVGSRGYGHQVVERIVVPNHDCGC